jgi:hypothetical protein
MSCTSQFDASISRSDQAAINVHEHAKLSERVCIFQYMSMHMYIDIDTYV